MRQCPRNCNEGYTRSIIRWPRIRRPSLFQHPAEVIYLSKMVAEMGIKPDHDIIGRVFSVVENYREFGVHLRIGEFIEGAGDNGNKRFDLCHKFAPGDAFFGKFLRPVTHVAGLSKGGTEVMAQAAD